MVNELAEEFKAGREVCEVGEFHGGGIGGRGGRGEAGGFDVGAGGEEAAGAGEDGEDGGGVGVEVAERGESLGDEVAAEVVQDGGAIELWL